MATIPTDSGPLGEVEVGLSDRLTRLERHLFSSFTFDPVGLLDFAQWSAGGKIIIPLTTPTFRVEGEGKWHWPIISPNNGQGREWRGPEVAISPVFGLGDCWPMKGTHGTLGVYLARTARVTSVTVEHAPRVLSFDVSSAPRDIEVWGTLTSPYTPGRYPRIRRGEEWEHELGLVLVAKFSYNVHAPLHAQTFPVLPQFNKLGHRIGMVVFFIRNNWGNADYTCIYRVRVHGFIAA